MRICIAIALSFLFPLMAQATCGFDNIEESALEVRSVEGLAMPDLIAADGTMYRLAGIFIPNEHEKIAREANVLIGSFLNEGPFSLHKISKKPNRYGMYPVILENGSGVSLNAKLLGSGLSMFWPGVVPRDCVEPLLHAEARALESKTGVWAKRYSMIDRAENPELVDKAGAFRIVEGKVLDVGETNSRLYLNFGRFWKEDFTVSVRKATAKRLNGGIEGLKALAGKRVRVRGWMISRRGPLIEIRSAGQIQRIAD